jgi:hypothetical protein
MGWGSARVRIHPSRLVVSPSECFSVMAAAVPLSSISFAVFFYPPFVFILFVVIKVYFNPLSKNTS